MVGYGCIAMPRSKKRIRTSDGTEYSQCLSYHDWVWAAIVRCRHFACGWNGCGRLALCRPLWHWWLAFQRISHFWLTLLSRVVEVFGWWDKRPQTNIRTGPQFRFELAAHISLTPIWHHNSFNLFLLLPNNGDSGVVIIFTRYENMRAKHADDISAQMPAGECANECISARHSAKMCIKGMSVQKATVVNTNKSEKQKNIYRVECELNRASNRSIQTNVQIHEFCFNRKNIIIMSPCIIRF